MAVDRRAPQWGLGDAVVGFLVGVVASGVFAVVELAVSFLHELAAIPT